MNIVFFIYYKGKIKIDILIEFICKYINKENILPIFNIFLQEYLLNLKYSTNIFDDYQL